MRTTPTSLARALAVRKHLCAMLRSVRTETTLSDAAATLASMLGHDSWAELKSRLEGRVEPSAFDGDLPDVSRDARLAFQAARLSARAAIPIDEACIVVAALRATARPTWPTDPAGEGRGVTSDGAEIRAYATRELLFLTLDGAVVLRPWLPKARLEGHVMMLETLSATQLAPPGRGRGWELPGLFAGTSVEGYVVALGRAFAAHASPGLAPSRDLEAVAGVSHIEVATALVRTWWDLVSRDEPPPGLRPASRPCRVSLREFAHWLPSPDEPVAHWIRCVAIVASDRRADPGPVSDLTVLTRLSESPEVVSSRFVSSVVDGAARFLERDAMAGPYAPVPPVGDSDAEPL